jgi:hypothetical protein
MKDIIKLLNRSIAQETRCAESVCNSLKEGELAILRLQNKYRSLEIELEEREQLIKEYRKCLKELSEKNQIKKKLVAATKQQIDINSSAAQISN